ncbi:Ras guanine nucleotide exchange factor bud5 [Exophiala xenobiotica]|uniref:Ras guanine nucleotide exchange factor bud5 n=1 Tax=Lithohypha guttulata TaxID=1690604 RepID=A0ABR0K785_9EURO|nr:Ras guanine nucleotide exchange factor bud5 [Lithohypha guttulata]KAK5314507.1 Ras guanine nucleotide exchange factor bud5 [Exophiala xenobiotica]
MESSMTTSYQKSHYTLHDRGSRTSYPQDHFSSTSITLPLASGDIVLVHSIHTNGWADGTLLETGARGWLPTNYCEPYDYATMRPLLKALTEFWDIIRSDGETTIELYRNHDYMRGMVAGVRFLLEKSDCLTRDAPMVKAHDSIRKTRKGLLSDLSLLVKASKNVQGSGLRSDAAEFESTCDDILLKAFQVVTRAVNFFDIWSDQAAFMRSPIAASISPEPLSPTLSTPHASTIRGPSKRSSLYRPQSPAGLVMNRNSRYRPASITRPPIMTHRMSYSGRNIHTYNGHLASEQLSDTYDAFLGVLASFLGSHMQSRSSSELLLSTQQAVKSCRKLLEVVEIILEHRDMTPTDGLQQAKDSMYDKITELVHAARDVFHPLHSEDEDMFYLPEEGIRLVNAATGCVSGAGRCVAKARVLLEEIGDFELELRSDKSEVNSPSDTHALSPTRVGPNTGIARQRSPLNSRRLSKPRLNIPQEKAMTEAMGSPTSDHSASSAEVDQAEVVPQAQQQQPLGRATLHRSESTLVSSARDSGPSFVSQTSTRATSPDSHLKGSPRLHEDEDDDAEDALMEQQFAHELVTNPEGRIIGGSLNAIIERLTSHEPAPDPSFVTMVYLTFRLFATPLGFAEALAYRFHYIEASPRMAQPVRLRVTNVFNGWLESHWRHDRDESTIPFIFSFVKDQVMPVSAIGGNRLLELLQVVATTHSPAVPRVLSTMGKTNIAASANIHTGPPAPQPVLSKSQLNALKTWRMGGSGLSVLDFDPLELARQLTIKTSSIFCSILPEELLGCEFMKDSDSLAVNVRALTTFSNDLANLVVDSILLLEDAKKRAAVIKQWIKIEAKLLELHNYETLITINASLMSSTIQRLRKTWDLIGQKTKSTMEEIKRVVDHAKNYAVLRQRISNRLAPCLPYVGIYRTDLTFIDQGCQATRELKTGDETISVINLDKHSKTAKIISDLQRFQVEYKLAPIDELQTWLQDECIRVRAAGERNFQNQYRRSLLLEPKLEPQQQPAPKRPNLQAFASMSSMPGKDRFDFLTWTHPKE